MSKIRVKDILHLNIKEKLRPNFPNTPEDRLDTYAWWFINNDSDSYAGIIAAFKEAIEAALDMAAEEAKTATSYTQPFLPPRTVVAKESILKIKEEIDYE